ncbi:MAG TPA: metalloregulator ArsR/SmtB family transcription factor, partial [Phycisphaerae bacterium]|nr:metalloregulator ArsR/SmtB family transcription factor [Phycisphaerae bacterium]
MARPELLFKAMADTTRQRLLRILASHDLTVSELVEVLDQPQSTVSRHLKILRESGLVVDRRAGNTVHYAALPPNPLLQAVQPQGDEAGTIGRKNGGQVTELRDQLLAWLACCELEEPTRLKLEHVLARRRAGEQGFFEVVGARWDQLRIEAFGESFHLEALTALLPTYWVVADIGTGTGYLLGALANRFNRVIAVDPAKAMLDVARQRPELKSATNVVFRQGSLDHLPLGDGEADLAIASLVLHHVEEPEQALAELARCLRPAGRLLIIEQEAHRLAEFHERMGDRWWGFEPQALVSQVEAAGFAEVDTQRLRSVRPANNGR